MISVHPFGKVMTKPREIGERRERGGRKKKSMLVQGNGPKLSTICVSVFLKVTCRKEMTNVLAQL